MFSTYPLPPFWRMFIVFWDTESHIFQSDPNNNSDSTAYSDMNLNRIRIAAVGSDLFQVLDLKEIGLDLK